MVKEIIVDFYYTDHQTCTLSDLDLLSLIYKITRNSLFFKFCSCVTFKDPDKTFFCHQSKDAYS